MGGTATGEQMDLWGEEGEDNPPKETNPWKDEASIWERPDLKDSEKSTRNLKTIFHHNLKRTRQTHLNG